MKLFILLILTGLFVTYIPLIQTYRSKSEYIIKKKPKVPEPNEWNVPQVPELSAVVYPGVEWHTLDQKYDEMVSGEDIAQIETMVGKALPNNAKLIAQVVPQLISNANKVKNR